MKIVYVYRPARSGGHSIEGLFRSISSALREQGITTIDYELRSPSYMLKDFFQLRNLEADVYHITGDVNYWAILLPWHKTVLTIHDIGHYLHGLKGWKRWLYGLLWFTIPIRASKHVTTVSIQTKNKLQDVFAINAERLCVIENCYNGNIYKFLAPKNNENVRILQIGTGLNKNVPRVIQALSDFCCTLVLVGKIDDSLDATLKASGIAYENYVDISTAAIVEQYAAADIVSFVSTHEGFGLPIIEAQAMGRPVITANILPMSDIAGRGACLVDPFDILSIREGFQLLIKDNSYRIRVVEAGLKNVQRFSLDTVIAKYLCMYKMSF